MKSTKKKAITSLTKEEKLLLFDALQEKKRRQREKREAFRPHLGQLTIAKSQAKIRILVCGNGFGKTAYGVNEAMWAAEGYNPVTKEYTKVPAKVFVVLDYEVSF